MNTTTPKVRVEQSTDDSLLTSAQVSRLRRGDFVGDGMSHGATWSWTRIRVVANDRAARTIVVRFPDGEYFVTDYDEANNMWVRWTDVADRPTFKQAGLATWAADAS